MSGNLGMCVKFFSTPQGMLMFLFRKSEPGTFGRDGSVGGHLTGPWPSTFGLIHHTGGEDEVLGCRFARWFGCLVVRSGSRGRVRRASWVSGP